MDEYDPNQPRQQIKRLGDKWGVPSIAGETLHACSLFGQNVLCEGHSFSPRIAPLVTDFLFAMTHLDGTISKKDGYSFVDTTGQEHVIAEYLLQYVYDLKRKGKDYLGVVEDYIHDTLNNFDKKWPISKQNQNVLDAWLKQQKKLWAQSAPAFFKKYPTFEKFQASFNQTENTISSAPTKIRPHNER